MVKLIIFDYAGVIVDSFPNVHAVYQIICNKLGRSCSENLEDFKKVYGHSSSGYYSQLGFSEEERIKGNVIFKEEILKKDRRGVGCFNICIARDFTEQGTVGIATFIS